MWLQDLNVELILKNCLSGNVRINENADPNKCSYSRCRIEFDSHSLIRLPNEWKMALGEKKEKKRIS